MKRVLLAVGLIAGLTVSAQATEFSLVPQQDEISSDASVVFSARRHHRHHYGLICGVTQMRHFGISDPRKRVALNWADDYPHVSPQPGAVVVQRRNGKQADGKSPGGHVSRIISMRGACRALVADEKGTYERDICKRTVAYVMPTHGDPGRVHVAARRHYRHHHRYAHRHHHRHHYAYRHHHRRRA